MAGRPFTRLPPGARGHLESMASQGMLSESAAATALGMRLPNFRKVIREHAPSKRIWEDAMAIERDALLEALYEKAVNGDVKAAQSLLAIRHGLTEKAPQGDAGKVSVTFNLPPAMDPAEYMKAVKVEQEALPGAGDS